MSHKAFLLANAIAFAAEHHKTQIDKQGKPYILHPLKVMYKLKTDDEELMAIAVLHDVVEDNKSVTWQKLRDIGMTKRVIKAVKALTKKPGQSHDEYMHALLSNVDAMKVKLSDLNHNSDYRRLKGIADKDLARLNKYAVMYHTILARLAELESY